MPLGVSLPPSPHPQNSVPAAKMRTAEDMLTPIDSGTAYVTNKRLLFNGEMKNASIKLQKILDFRRIRHPDLE